MMAPYDSIAAHHCLAFRLRQRSKVQMPLPQAPQPLCSLGLDQPFEVTMRQLGAGFRPQPRQQRLELVLGRRKGFKTVSTGVCLLHEGASLNRNGWLALNHTYHGVLPLSKHVRHNCLTLLH